MTAPTPSGGSDATPLSAGDERLRAIAARVKVLDDDGMHETDEPYVRSEVFTLIHDDIPWLTAALLAARRGEHAARDIAKAWEIAMQYVRAGCAAWIEGDGHTGYHAGCTSMHGRHEGHGDSPLEAMQNAEAAARTAALAATPEEKDATP